MGGSNNTCSWLLASTGALYVINIWADGNFWQMMATDGNLWQLMATEGNFWQMMATFGNRWQLMATDRNFWVLMATFGSWWQLLATHGSCWPMMAAVAVVVLFLQFLLLLTEITSGVSPVIFDLSSVNIHVFVMLSWIFTASFLSSALPRPSHLWFER